MGALRTALRFQVCGSTGGGVPVLWGMRLLVGLALFGAAASERVLLLAGIVACAAALAAWEIWRLQFRRRDR